MHTEKYDVTYLIKDDNVSKTLQQHVTMNHNSHLLDKTMFLNPYGNSCNLYFGFNIGYEDQ